MGNLRLGKIASSLALKTLAPNLKPHEKVLSICGLPHYPSPHCICSNRTDIGCFIETPFRLHALQVSGCTTSTTTPPPPPPPTSTLLPSPLRQRNYNRHCNGRAIKFLDMDPRLHTTFIHNISSSIILYWALFRVPIMGEFPLRLDKEGVHNTDPKIN